MECPKCHQSNHYKNGFKSGKQRYKCRVCGCNFTQSHPRGYSNQIKQKALRYYLDGIGLRRIERLLCVSHVSVLKWVRKYSQLIKEHMKNNPAIKRTDLLELDELCTYIKKNNIDIGSGSGLREIPKKYWDTILALVN